MTERQTENIARQNKTVYIQILLITNLTQSKNEQSYMSIVRGRLHFPFASPPIICSAPFSAEDMSLLDSWKIHT